MNATELQLVDAGVNYTLALNVIIIIGSFLALVGYLLYLSRRLEEI